MFDYLQDNKDVIKALAYINVDCDQQLMWGPPHAGSFCSDSRLESNARIARRFNQAVKDWKMQK